VPPVFQDDFARAFEESGADEISGVRVSADAAENERCRWTRSSRCTRRRTRAHIPTWPRSSDRGGRGREGDLVVIMSNGGFDGIHDKLLSALARGPR
jgi:UDP-N-acetylmuramate-alanine ligase